VTVTWFTVQDSSFLLEEESVSIGVLPRQNPGFFGSAIVAVSLLNINTTEDIVGLSSARSCTHNSPTCMHLRTSEGEYELSMEESISFKAFCSFQSFQLYKKKNQFIC
jgi:hypothetical protein